MIDTHVYLHASHTQRTPRSLAPPRSSPPPPLQPPPHTQENVLVLIFVFPDAPVCKLPFLNASAFSCALSSSCLLNSVYSVVGTRNAANIDNANTGNSVGSTCLPSSPPPPSAIVAQLLKNEQPHCIEAAERRYSKASKSERARGGIQNPARESESEGGIQNPARESERRRYSKSSKSERARGGIQNPTREREPT